MWVGRSLERFIFFADLPSFFDGSHFGQYRNSFKLISENMDGDGKGEHSQRNEESPNPETISHEATA